MYKPTDLDFYELIKNRIDVDKIRRLTKEKWEKNILTLQKSNSMSESVNVGMILEKGDIVTISTKSNQERFNKEGVTVTLGIGLYCKELENAIIGTVLGEQKEYVFTYRGEEIVAFVKTESAKRNKEISIDDEFVKNHELEERYFPSFEEYKKYWCNLNFKVDLQSAFIEKCYMKIAQDTAKMSGIVASQQMRDNIAKQCDMWREEEVKGLNNDELKYYQIFFGQDIQTLEEGLKKYNQHIDNNALMNTYAMELAKIDQIDVTEETFLKEMEKVAKAEQVELNIILESVTFEDYRKSIFQENLSKYILEILNQYIKKEGISYES